MGRPVHNRGEISRSDQEDGPNSETKSPPRQSTIRAASRQTSGWNRNDPKVLDFQPLRPLECHTRRLKVEALSFLNPRNRGRRHPLLFSRQNRTRLTESLHGLAG
jgi:hypothetical protein